MVIYSQEPTALQATVGESVVMLDPQTFSFYSLNPFARRIWDLLGERSLEEDQIVAVLVDEFEVQPDECAAAVDEFLQTAMAKGLVICE